jgi:hypothetical protein
MSAHENELHPTGSEQRDPFFSRDLARRAGYTVPARQRLRHPL